MDVGIFVVGITLGVATGLICRRNNINLMPNYYNVDMGVLGKSYYNQTQE
jgi:hypothetical protein